MKEAVLKRLVSEGTIMSYKVLETDHDGNVIEYKIRHFAFNKPWYEKLLEGVYQKTKRGYVPSNASRAIR